MSAEWIQLGSAKQLFFSLKVRNAADSLLLFISPDLKVKGRFTSSRHSDE